ESTFRDHALVEDTTMHKIAISPAALDRMTRRMGKLHPFDTMAPRKTGLLVIDMQKLLRQAGASGARSRRPARSCRTSIGSPPVCGGVAAMSSGFATAPGTRVKAGRPCMKT